MAATGCEISELPLGQRRPDERSMAVPCPDRIYCACLIRLSIAWTFGAGTAAQEQESPVARVGMSPARPTRPLATTSVLCYAVPGGTPIAARIPNRPFHKGGTP